MPYRRLQAGDEVFIRAVVVEAMSDCFKLRIEDHPDISITTFAPVTEIARFEDIPMLPPPRRGPPPEPTKR